MAAHPLLSLHIRMLAAAQAAAVTAAHAADESLVAQFDPRSSEGTSHSSSCREDASRDLLRSLLASELIPEPHACQWDALTPPPTLSVEGGAARPIISSSRLPCFLCRLQWGRLREKHNQVSKTLPCEDPQLGGAPDPCGLKTCVVVTWMWCVQKGR